MSTAQGQAKSDPPASAPSPAGGARAAGAPGAADDWAARARGRERSFVGEYWAFLRENKKWWLLPILVALLIVGVLVVLGGTAVAPFIYTLF